MTQLAVQLEGQLVAQVKTTSHKQLGKALFVQLAVSHMHFEPLLRRKMWISHHSPTSISFFGKASGRCALLVFLESSGYEKNGVSGTLCSAIKPALLPKRGPRRVATLFCFLKKLSEVRMLTTFCLAKNDHRWVTFISFKNDKKPSGLLAP